MNIAINIIKTSFVVLVAIVLAAIYATMPVLAQEEVQPVTEEVQITEEQITEEQPVEEQPAEEDGVNYTFTAQPGDSYTEIARKVTQIYGIENEVNLTGEQIVYVETNLTILAGSPELNLGEQVVISQSLVEEWVESAVNLSESELSRWTKYASSVDFNTDSVGEARA